MNYSEFSRLVTLCSEVSEGALDVSVRVKVRLRSNGHLVANVGARMDRQFNEGQMRDALIQGTLQPLGWDTLVRGAKRMLFYHILASFKIENVPDLKDAEVDTVLPSCA